MKLSDCIILERSVIEERIKLLTSIHAKNWTLEMCGEFDVLQKLLKESRPAVEIVEKSFEAGWDCASENVVQADRDFQAYVPNYNFDFEKQQFLNSDLI